jgi:hypothetical protein
VVLIESSNFPKFQSSFKIRAEQQSAICGLWAVADWPSVSRLIAFAHGDTLVSRVVKPIGTECAASTSRTGIRVHSP